MRGCHVSDDGGVSGSVHDAAMGFGSRDRNHVAVEAANAEAITGDEWSFGAYRHGWRQSEAHSATPAAEGSHNSLLAKSRNRSMAANGGFHTLAISSTVRREWTVEK
jgi:hypothetical protein